MTALNMTLTTDMLMAESALWDVIVDEVMFVISLIGIIANTVTLVTLIVNGDDFSEIIRMLLKYQSLLDAFNCLLGMLIFRLPPILHFGYAALDYLFCHLWTPQHLYWVGVFLSNWNLVCLAFERYVCVCHPLKYHQLTKKKMRLIMLTVFSLGMIYLLPGVFQTNMKAGYCVNELYWKGNVANTFFFVWALSAFFTFYAIPTVLVVSAYGMVINSFRKRAKANLGASGAASVIDRASAELTKTAVVVTVVFILAYSFDAWLFLLAYAGVTEYIMKSPTQKIGAFLSLFNLVANPFVYASLMPSYRRSVMKTICFFRKK